MLTQLKVAAIATIIVLTTACTAIAPQYQAQVNNVDKLTAVKSDLQVTGFTIDKKLNSISLRGSSLESPVEKSFAKYIENALILELSKAKLYNTLSPRIITAEVVQNELDASGFSTGEGVISVAFTITENEQTLFEKTITSKVTWESSFMGAVAIPNAISSYPKLVSTLLADLYSDVDFVNALKG
ncbi:MAG: hypothetical protein ACSHW0_04375 [Thalassotalea sp.]